MHKQKFLDCSVLVSPSDEILGLKKDTSFIGRKFVYTHHGAGDREYGFGKWVTEFDLIFVSSYEIKNRFEQSEQFNREDAKKFNVIGYPKFDLCLNNPKSSFFFENKKPVVLYNSHF